MERAILKKAVGIFSKTDITYTRVNSDWVYLTTIIDLADRKVIGRCVSDDMRTENPIIKAWNKPINNRPIGENLLFHSHQ